MNELPSYKTIDEKIAKNGFVTEAQQRMAALNTNPHKLSLSMGYNRGYIYKQLQHNNQSASLLVLLSHYLQANMFQRFLDVLPPQLSITKRETELQNQINSLQQQLDEMTKERDIYKTIALK